MGVSPRGGGTKAKLKEEGRQLAFQNDLKKETELTNRVGLGPPRQGL